MFTVEAEVMEAVLATFGGILILLSIGGGTFMKTKFVQTDQYVPAGDRIASGLIGAALIAISLVLNIDAPSVSVIGTFAIFAGLTVLYAIFLFATKT